MIRVSKVVTPYGKADLDGFVGAFIHAFSGEPYNESYIDEEVVNSVWHPHLEMGSIILAHDDELDANSVVGFGCAIPLPKAPQEVQTFLHQRQLDKSLPSDFIPAKTWYMSELGVLTSYRERGLAYQLVRHRLISINHAGGTHYVMRTAAEGSMSRHLYERLGAQLVAVEHDISSSDQVKKNGSTSTKRVYLYGKTSDALRWIDGRG